jgi:hypothetical protein
MRRMAQCYKLIIFSAQGKKMSDESSATGIDSTWCPLTGKRVFKSAREAWIIYGQFRFAVSERTFYNYVGKKKVCGPRQEGAFHVEDIEQIARVQAWPPTPSFVRPSVIAGGRGETETNKDTGEEIQRLKAENMRMENEFTRIKLEKELGKLIEKNLHEQLLAAGAAIVGIEAEIFVYDNVREIIHLCEGKPEKEDFLREYLLSKVRIWLNAFSQAKEYIVELEEGSDELQ